MNQRAVDYFVGGIQAKDRSVLARAITLIESKKSEDQVLANAVLQAIMPLTGHSTRIGITGVPGVGKSTFIDRMGLYLCEQNHPVAVLTIDPSSPISGGSVLGDKSRMQELARHPLSFIRPTPSQGTLGGIHVKTLETIFLCEAAGFDVVIIETVGVGQNEFSVHDLVDFFLLLVLTGAGDELQMIKKGVLELADMILVHKADGKNSPVAAKVAHQFNQILPFIRHASDPWQCTAQAFSSTLAGEHEVAGIWTSIETNLLLSRTNQTFEKRRRQQTEKWFDRAIEHAVLQRILGSEPTKALIEQTRKHILADKLSIIKGLEQVLGAILPPQK